MTTVAAFKQKMLCACVCVCANATHCTLTPMVGMGLVSNCYSLWREGGNGLIFIALTRQLVAGDKQSNTIQHHITMSSIALLPTLIVNNKACVRWIDA